MIPLPRDFREFIQLLNKQHVKYLVVGGYAVGYHGYPRYTGDLDVFVELSDANAENLAEVFRRFGLTGSDLAAQDFLEKGIVIRLGREPMRLEIINDINGVSFEDCFRAKVTARMGGLRVNFIDLAHLRKNKAAAGRPKDLEDLRRLPTSRKNRRK
jgi:predicted nucleotidyltransferase